MKFTRHYTTGNKPVFEQIKWKTVRAFIKGVVDMEVEVPEQWSQNAANILAKNYLRRAGVPKYTTPFVTESIPSWLQRHSIPSDIENAFGGETSAEQVFHRMAGHWTYTGWKHKYFNSEEDAKVFYDEIYYMLAMQIAAPNSPQWFNTGLWWAYAIEGPASGQWAINYENGEPYETTNAYEHPQPHACFIQPVSDDLVNPGGIMDLWTREVRLFKQGSGTGSNFSNIRGKGEPIGGGGVSSGLMSFLRIGDVAAGSIASGGTTRRAAKMVCLDLDHPEIEDFINWKVSEERKALAMNVGSEILNKNDGGRIYGIDFEGEAINTVSGQNSNNSVRVTDDFMSQIGKGSFWPLVARTNKDKVTKMVELDDLWNQICHAAWASANPGVQFHDTINSWNTCKADGAINASNPCGEYNFLDNTACNLASLNLCRFLNPDNTINLESFEHAVRFWTVVLDISVTMASFPSREIALGSYNYRTLGLGYANAGGLLARLNLSYDSDEGRALIAAITALMHGEAYLTSAKLVTNLEPFPRWPQNADCMAKVLQMHKDRVKDTSCIGLAGKVVVEAERVWAVLGGGLSFRNAQVTLLAPTGTISFVMDCETTGIEPYTAPTIVKSLAGGGTMNINNNVPESECAFPSRPGGPCLRPMAHVLMVAAVQPFLSGAVSKTVNMPNSATIEDVDHIYREAHRLGLKAIAIYRDGCKLSQPLNVAGEKMEEKPERKVPRYDKEEIKLDNDSTLSFEGNNSDKLHSENLKEKESHKGRHRLPARCTGYRQKFRVNDHPVYLHTGEYEDGTLGEIFIELSDEGSTLRAMANALAKAISLGIQFGTPLEEYVDAFVASRFEPAGLVEGHETIKTCSSVLSAVFRELGIHYLKRTELGNIQPETKLNKEIPIVLYGASGPAAVSGMFCSCGTLMNRTGSCYTCPNCGSNTGCG